MSENPFKPAARDSAVVVELGCGLVSIIDAEDSDLVGRYKWKPLARRHGIVYAARSIHGRRGSGATVLMHRFILDAPAGAKVDHINRDSLDNRRGNLRLATESQNQANTVARGGTSQYKGVSRERRTGLWKVQVAHATVGRYADEIEAAKAYDQAALARWGDFARLNFPPSFPLIQSQGDAPHE